MKAAIVVTEPHNLVKSFSLPANSFHIFCFVHSHLLIGLTYYLLELLAGVIDLPHCC